LMVVVMVVVIVIVMVVVALHTSLLSAYYCLPLEKGTTQDSVQFKTLVLSKLLTSNEYTLSTTATIITTPDPPPPPRYLL
jgi:hypothetical protein